MDLNEIFAARKYTHSPIFIYSRPHFKHTYEGSSLVHKIHNVISFSLKRKVEGIVDKRGWEARNNFK